jgi:hypothetical protein
MEELLDFCAHWFLEVDGDPEFGCGVGVFHLLEGETQNVAHLR